MAEKPQKKEKKPWEEDVFGVKKPQAKATPPPKKKPTGPTQEAEDTLRKIRRRNEELVKRYGEPRKKDKKRKDSKRR
jgi:hypothetical protein